MATPKYYYTYVLACADGTLYTGYTTDPDRREQEHTTGRGAKYTKPERRRPCHMLLTKAYETKHDAMSMEARFKRLSRKQKEQVLREHGVKQISYQNLERIDLPVEGED